MDCIQHQGQRVDAREKEHSNSRRRSIMTLSACFISCLDWTAGSGTHHLSDAAKRKKMMLKDIASLIIKYTVPTRRHLTPELLLRLVTPETVLWRATEDQVPFRDPFWAFYWPGGQATARYILDNGEIIKNKRVLDVGCGCGAGSIAAAKMQAKHVVGNDIDPYAVVATKINSELNNVAIEMSTDNFIGAKCEEFDTILIGDMFYDEEFANMLFEWLISLVSSGKTVLIGDPGRHGLTEKRRQH